STAIHHKKIAPAAPNHASRIPHHGSRLPNRCTQLHRIALICTNWNAAIAMKPNCQRKSLPNHPDTGTPAHRTAEASAHTPKSLASYHRRHNGNVARLPKLVRDKVNTMLLDGVTYPALIKNLGADGKGLI